MTQETNLRKKFGQYSQQLLGRANSSTIVSVDYAANLDHKIRVLVNEAQREQLDDLDFCLNELMVIIGQCLAVWQFDNEESREVVEFLYQSINPENLLTKEESEETQCTIFPTGKEIRTKRMIKAEELYFYIMVLSGHVATNKILNTEELIEICDHMEALFFDGYILKDVTFFSVRLGQLLDVLDRCLRMSECDKESQEYVRLETFLHSFVRVMEEQTCEIDTTQLQKLLEQ